MATVETVEASAGIRTDLDPDRQRVAKEYAGIKRRLFFVELGLSVLGVLLLLFAGWSVALRDWAQSISTNPWAVVALYAIALGVIYTVLSLPLDYYSGFLLPHKYGMSTQSLGSWGLDNLKGLAISAVFGLVGLEVLYWLLRT